MSSTLLTLFFLGCSVITADVAIHAHAVCSHMAAAILSRLSLQACTLYACQYACSGLVPSPPVCALPELSLCACLTASQDGFGEFQVTQWNGRRADAFQTYLKPALGRENLKVCRQPSGMHGSYTLCSCRPSSDASMRWAGTAVQQLGSHVSDANEHSRPVGRSSWLSKQGRKQQEQ
jgi:hypothetical protein